ncbi:LAME_0F18514g1_1 [Lachancea meyersii CBS 8951]|uniref:LAME_0F18514g1_1 n=1 Tax=Lachancea meyersii CBS 8951 TaxID=1266667 RepID=A0A1G4K0Q0_9SACH|nr:LAME_0F18514g1_1 [Lachancea meyersii CBS 8951]
MLPEHHPIFKCQPFETGRLKRFVCHSESNDHKTVVVEGNSIKWCLPEESEYKFVDFTAITNCTNAVLNSLGTLLCLYSDRELQILSLDGAHSRETPIEYRIPVSRGVKQVLWHPNARLDSCFVVLTPSDEICMYELLSENVTEPTGVWNSSTFKPGTDTTVRDIVSIAFSNDGMTLYALNTSEGADIYSIYPFLPSEVELSDDAIQYCFHKALLQYNGLADGDSPQTKHQVTRQLQFASQLHTQLQKHRSEPGKTDPLVLPVSSSFRKAVMQGPYTINPFPERLYLATAVQLNTLNLNDNTSEILLISFDDGTILHCFPDSEPTMAWESVEVCQNNSLVTIKAMNLPGLIAVTSKSAFVVLSPQKASLVDVSRLTKTIDQALRDCDISELAEADLSEQIIEQQGSFETATLWSTGLQFVLLSKTSTSHLDIPTSKKTLIPREQKHIEKSTQRRPYDQPMTELLALNKKVQSLMKTPLSTTIEPRLRQVKLDNASNEEQLSVLTDISKELLTRVMVAQTSVLSLHTRVMGQQGELTKQLEMVCEIKTKKKEICEKLIPQQERWRCVEKKNESIKNRFTALQHKLKQISASDEIKSRPIARSEMEWFMEVKNQISKFNRLVYSQRDLNETLSVLKTELEYVKVDGNSTTPGAVDDVSWEELRELLAKDAKIIGECQAELQTAANELG